ncbi:curlin, partial [Shewanella sp. 10N.286.51.B2]
AEIEQQYYNGFNATATVNQLGDSNSAKVMQNNADGALSTINQTGNGDNAEIRNYVSDFADATINQSIGSGNDAYINQDNSDGAS